MRKWFAAASAALLFASSCSAAPTEPTPSSLGRGGDSPGFDELPAVLVGSGDIAVCGSPGSELTARVLDRVGGAVFTAGDHAYPNGTAADFRDCYDPTWGRHRWRTRPSPGNHDYDSPGAAPYFQYFGRTPVRPASAITATIWAPGTSSR